MDLTRLLRDRHSKQKIAALLLLYASWVTYKCPCDKVNSCHLPQFFLSVGGATAIVLHDNMR
jgi:hypothetical protein